MKKHWLFFLIVMVQLRALQASQFENRSEYEALDRFFKMGIEEEGYGYVLEGVKPIAVRTFYALSQFPFTKNLKYAEREFTNTLLLLDALPVWNKFCSQQKHFALKAVPFAPNSPSLEVQFINIPKLKEIIETNIDLFRYVLGPNLKSDQLVGQIAFSPASLKDILHDDRVLEGILLGFGTYNSLIGGRLDTIDGFSLTKDFPPFLPKCQPTDHPKELGLYYLEHAGGDDSSFRHELQQSQNFSIVREELEAMSEPLPPSLTEKPVFIFGPFKGGSSNQPLFSRLQQAQKQTKALLKKKNLLDRVLKKIGIKKIRLQNTPSPPKSQEWRQLLQSISGRFKDHKKQEAFIEAFRHPSGSSRMPPEIISASEAMFDGIQKALKNLRQAETDFDTLSKDESLQAIVPRRLYFKNTQTSSENPIGKADRLRMNYVIKDFDGNILFANHDLWLSLSQTIPGFAHGVQGMRVGEKRTIFVHPVFAYGALTTLPPCKGLIIEVHVLDADTSTQANLSTLIPLDLSWIQDPHLSESIQKSLEQQPRFMGSFYHDQLAKIAKLDEFEQEGFFSLSVGMSQMWP